MNDCSGCCAYKDDVCIYLIRFTLNKSKTIIDCPCMQCLVKVTCESVCDKLTLTLNGNPDIKEAYRFMKTNTKRLRILMTGSSISSSSYQRKKSYIPKDSIYKQINQHIKRLR